jgi:hypothetical protein
VKSPSVHLQAAPTLANVWPQTYATVMELGTMGVDANLVGLILEYVDVLLAVCTTPCTHGVCSGPDTCNCVNTGYTGALCEIRKTCS